MKHKNIAEWAQGIGSKATTKKGQIRAIRKDIRDIQPIFEQKHYYRSREYGRTIEYIATCRAETLGYALVNPEYAAYCEAYKINDQINTWESMPSITLSDGFKESYVAAWNNYYPDIELGNDYRAVIAWDTNSDWDYYSKGYGRPKNTYSDRRVGIRHKFNGKILNIPVNTFQGEFLRKSLIQAAQKLALPWLIEAVRNIPTKKKRLTVELR